MLVFCNSSRIPRRAMGVNTSFCLLSDLYVAVSTFILQILSLCLGGYQPRLTQLQNPQHLPCASHVGFNTRLRYQLSMSNAT